MSFQSGGPLLPFDDEGKVISGDVHFKDTWVALENAVDDGLVKSIGKFNVLF